MVRKQKILFVILDGAGDGLKKNTSLELAHKPNLDAFAQNGFSGLIDNKSGAHPDSGNSIWQLFGYTLDKYPGRGFLDALGIGLPPRPDTLYMRANFATVDKKMTEVAQGQFEPRYFVKDRRGGRDATGLNEIAKDIEEMNIDGFKVKLKDLEELAELFGMAKARKMLIRAAKRLRNDATKYGGRMLKFEFYLPVHEKTFSSAELRHSLFPDVTNNKPRHEYKRNLLRSM